MSNSLLILQDVKDSLGLSGGGGGGGGGGFTGITASSGAGTVTSFAGSQSGATITVPLASIPAGLTNGSKYYVKVWANIALSITASSSLANYTFTPHLSGCLSDGSTFNSANNIVVGNSSTTLTNVWVSQTSQQYYATLTQSLQAFEPVVLEGYYTATDANINIDTVITISAGNASTVNWDGDNSTLALSAIWSPITTYSP